jgi:hypothetical protein
VEYDNDVEPPVLRFVDSDIQQCYDLIRRQAGSERRYEMGKSW